MSRSSPIPLQLFDASTSQSGRPVALPAAVFSDPEFHDFELDAIWSREWFCIGRVSDIPNPGDYYTISIGKDPLLVVRQKDLTVRVLGNVCQHRGQLLAEGRGNARRLRCPMHSWVYDLSGALISAPGLNDDPSFEKHSVCLPIVRSEVWQGFVFVSFEPKIAPLAPRLERLKAQLANYELGGLRADEPLKMELNEWNWKQYIDECYHCMHLHAQSWGNMYPVSPQTLNEDSEFNDEPNGIIAYELISPFVDASPTRTGKVAHPVLTKLTEQERSRLGYITVAPNLLIVAMPDKVKYFIWLPATATQSWYGVSWIYPATTLADPGFRERLRREQDELSPVMVEDYSGWRRYQVGVESRFAPRGRLSGQERVIARYQDWLIARYRRASSPLPSA